jgi:hypothetical protein
MAFLRLLNRLFHGPGVVHFPLHGDRRGLALCSFNLLALFQANFNFLATYGAVATFRGGILQVLELTAWGNLALACYVAATGATQSFIPARDRSRPVRRIAPILSAFGG